MQVHRDMVEARRVKMLSDAERMAADCLTPSERMRFAVAVADDPRKAYEQAKIAEYQRAMFQHLGELKD